METSTVKYEIEKILRDNNRFLVAKIKHQGKTRILKKANSKDTFPNLRAEVENIQFFQKAISASASFLRVPKVYFFNEDFYIAEYFSKKQLISREDNKRVVCSAAKKMAEYLYEVFFFFFFYVHVLAQLRIVRPARPRTPGWRL